MSVPTPNMIGLDEAAVKFNPPPPPSCPIQALSFNEIATFEPEPPSPILITLLVAYIFNLLPIELVTPIPTLPAESIVTFSLPPVLKRIEPLFSKYIFVFAPAPEAI